MEDLRFYTMYKGKEYTFNFGIDAYVFHAAIYNELDEKHGEQSLLEFVALTSNCYMADSNDTPLGELCDYIAEHWNEVKSMGKFDILNKFYYER